MAVINNLTGVFGFLNPEDPSYCSKYAEKMYPTMLHACYAAMTNDVNTRVLIEGETDIRNLPNYLDGTPLLMEEVWDRLVDIVLEKFSKYEFGNKMVTYVNPDEDMIEYISNNKLFGKVPGQEDSVNALGRIMTLVAKYGASKENIMNTLFLEAK